MFKRIIVAISIVTSVFAGFVWYNEDWQTFLYASFMTGVMYLRYWVVRVLFLAKSFVFVGGVVSFTTIAWKKVLLISVLALLKRAWINSMVAVINHRIKQPLIAPLRLYLKYQWLHFKAYHLWKKALYVLLGLVPSSVALYLIGLWETITYFLGKISIAKFLTLVLAMITEVFGFVMDLWNAWVQPYIDFIIITVVIGFIEKFPVIGYFFRCVRIMGKKYSRRLRHRKNRLLDKHLGHRVNQLAQHIHHCANQKKQALPTVEPEKSVDKPSTD